jgi:hypothetical protein
MCNPEHEKAGRVRAYIMSLEDALNAYDGWIVALLMTKSLGAAECYDTMHKAHGEAITAAITSSLARKGIK